MKILKLLFSTLLLFSVSCLISCDDNDKHFNITDADLIGVWTCTGYYYDGEAYTYIRVINQDGSIYHYNRPEDFADNRYEYNYGWKGTWQLIDKTIEVDHYGIDYIAKYIITGFNDKTLNIISSNGEEIWFKME